MLWSKSNPFAGIKGQSKDIQNIFYNAANVILKTKGSEEEAIRAGWNAVKKKYKRRGSKWVPKKLSYAVILQKRVEGQPLASGIDMDSLPRSAFIINRASKRVGWKYPVKYIDKSGSLVLHAELVELSHQQAHSDKASKNILHKLQSLRRRIGLVESHPTKGEQVMAQERRKGSKGTMGQALKEAERKKVGRTKRTMDLAKKRSKEWGIRVLKHADDLVTPKGKGASELWLDPVNWHGFIGSKKSVASCTKNFRKLVVTFDYNSTECKLLWNRLVLAKQRYSLSHVYSPLAHSLDGGLEGEALTFAKSSSEVVVCDEKFCIEMPLVTDESGSIKLFKKTVDVEGEPKEVLIIKGEATNTGIDKEDERIGQAFLKKIKEKAQQVRMPAFKEHKRDIEHTIGYIDPDETEGSAKSVIIGIAAEDPEENPHVAQIVQKSKHGTPLGLSIGGRITKVKKTFSESLGRPINDLLDGEIFEVSVTALPAIYSNPLSVVTKAVSKASRRQVTSKELKETLQELMEAQEIEEQINKLWWLFRDKFREITGDDDRTADEKKADLRDLTNDFVQEFTSLVQSFIDDFVKHFKFKL